MRRAMQGCQRRRTRVVDDYVEVSFDGPAEPLGAQLAAWGGAPERRSDARPPGLLTRSGQFGEEAHERLLLIRREWREHGVLDVVERGVQPLERAGTTFRDGDDVATTVRRIGFALGESARDQVVQHGDDIASVDAGVPSEISLAGGAVLVESRQQSEVIAAETLGGEGILQQALRPSIGTTQ
jgi:hypothetical protein